MNFITILGLAMVFIYSLVKILDFLNVDKSKKRVGELAS